MKAYIENESDEERLAAISRTIDETRCPEGLDVPGLVKSSIEKYWDRREKYVKEQQELELTTAKLARQAARNIEKMELAERKSELPVYHRFGKYARIMAEEALDAIKFRLYGIK
jgi:hypothetical protein